jgi:hypothetical protein
MPHEIDPEPPEWAQGEWLAIWQRTSDQLRGIIGIVTPRQRSFDLPRDSGPRA